MENVYIIWTLICILSFLYCALKYFQARKEGTETKGVILGGIASILLAIIGAIASQAVVGPDNNATAPPSTEFIQSNVAGLQLTTKKTTTTKPITTTEISTTTEIITTKVNPRVSIEFGDVGGETVEVFVKTIPEGGSIQWYSEKPSVAAIEDDTIIAKGEGSTILKVKYALDGEVVTDSIKIDIDTVYGEPYTTYEKVYDESQMLVSEKKEYQYYRYVCDKCGYRDCYGYAVCNKSYPQNNTCTGCFTKLETKWSDINPDSLGDHSFKGIKSIAPENGTGKEWYWFPEFGASHNDTRTVYTYKSVNYKVANIFPL